jgi:hypothetical protein
MFYEESKIQRAPPLGRGNVLFPVAADLAGGIALIVLARHLIVERKEDSTDYGSRSKNWRGELGFSADHGQRAGSFAINALREKTPSHVLRDCHVRRWLGG